MADDLVYIPTDYPDNYLECRVEGHAWQRCDPFDAGVPYGFPRYRWCPRCGQRKAQSYNRLGESVFSRRLYPEDNGNEPYMLKGAGLPDERPQPREYRQLWFKRTETEWVEAMDDDGVRAEAKGTKVIRASGKVVKLQRKRAS